MKKILVCIFVGLLISTPVFSQTDDEVYELVETMPQYPGGESAMYAFLGKNVKYPAMAREGGIQGKVYVEFTIKKDGSVADVSIKKGIGGGCDEEVIRVVKLFPKWIPGTQNGKPVNVKMMLPFNFTLK